MSNIPRQRLGPAPGAMPGMPAGVAKVRRERLEYEGAAVVLSVFFHILMFVFFLNYNVRATPAMEAKPFQFKVSRVDMPFVPLPLPPVPPEELAAQTAQPAPKTAPPAVEKFVAPPSLAKPGVAGIPPSQVPAPAIPEQLQIGSTPLAKPPSALESARVSRELVAIQQSLTAEKPNRPMIEAPPIVPQGQDLPAPGALTERLLTAKRVGVGGTGAMESPTTQPLTQIYGPGAPTVEKLMKEAVKPPPPKPRSPLPSASLEAYVNVDLYTWHDPANPTTGYFQVRVGARPDSPLRVIPRDVIFIVDVSASITRKRVEPFKAGVRAALDLLHPADRFNIIRFRQNVDFVSPTFLPASEAKSERVQQFIHALHSEGTTDFFGSLLPLSQLNRERGRLLQAIVLSDGQPTVGILDTLQILHRFGQINAGRTSVSTFAGGKDVNQFLLGFLAQRNQGRLDYVSQPEAMAGTFLQICQAYANPLLLDVEFRFAGVDQEEVYPRTPPHFYRDMPLTLYGRYPRSQLKRLAVQIRGEAVTGQPMELTAVRDFPAQDNGISNIALDWAQQKIAHLIMRWIDTGDKAFHDQAVALAHQFRIPVPALRR